jgi:pre-mRNA-splicing factor ATP-dependent RNA helicase DHX16
MSALFKVDPPPRLVVFHELVRTTRDYVRCVSEVGGVGGGDLTAAQIEPEWLLEIAPHLYRPKDLEELKQKKLPKALGARPSDG